MKSRYGKHGIFVSNYLVPSVSILLAYDKISQVVYSIMPSLLNFVC